MPTTPAFRYAVAWIVASLVIVAGAIRMIKAALLDGTYIPSNADAFYHARRILDSVMTGAPVAQFDPLIHVPEGSWLTWPWGFDAMMAGLTSLFGPFESEKAASAVLMQLPVAMAPLATLLAIGIAWRLRAGLLYSTLFALAMAALPYVFFQFSVGNIDHHFAELLWVLGTYFTGLWLMGEDRSRWAAASLGVVLGTAVAIHNGLFVLQLAVLAGLAWRWLRSGTFPARGTAVVFAAALIVSTLVVSIPSQPWRDGRFEFYTLSWFHTYIASAVAIMTVVLAMLPRSPRSIAIAAVMLGALTLPVIGIIGYATSFAGGGLESTRDILEAMSPYALHMEYGAYRSVEHLSLLMWLAAPATLLNLWWACTTRDARLQFFAVLGAGFLVMLQLQYRFGVFGVVALLMTPLLALQMLAGRMPAGLRRNGVIIAGVLLLGVAYVPTLKPWGENWARGGNPLYLRMRAGFAALGQACERRPGVVLAQIEDGHWVRFHSKCSVIGNVFLLTPQHAQKRAEVEQLLRGPPAAVVSDRPDVTYVMAHHRTELEFPDGQGGREVPDLEDMRPALPSLVGTLLGDLSALPAQYRVLWELKTPAGRVYARLFEIDRQAAGAPTP